MTLHLSKFTRKKNSHVTWPSLSLSYHSYFQPEKIPRNLENSHSFHFSLHVTSSSVACVAHPWHRTHAPVHSAKSGGWFVQSLWSVRSLPAGPGSHESVLPPPSRWWRGWNSWPQTWQKTQTKLELCGEKDTTPQEFAVLNEIHIKTTTPGMVIHSKQLQRIWINCVVNLNINKDLHMSFDLTTPDSWIKSRNRQLESFTCFHWRKPV